MDENTRWNWRIKLKEYLENNTGEVSQTLIWVFYFEVVFSEMHKQNKSRPQSQNWSTGTNI